MLVYFPNIVSIIFRKTSPIGSYLEPYLWSCFFTDDSNVEIPVNCILPEFAASLVHCWIRFVQAERNEGSVLVTQMLELLSSEVLMPRWSLQDLE